MPRGEKNHGLCLSFPFPCLGAVGSETPMPKAAAACEAVCCLGMVGLHTTPWRSMPCLVGFWVLSLWVLLWAAGSLAVWCAPTRRTSFFVHRIPRCGRGRSQSNHLRHAPFQRHQGTGFLCGNSPLCSGLLCECIATAGVGVPPVLHLGLYLTWPGA